MMERKHVLDLAYAHANMRLKTRFGFEIEKEHWLNLSQHFKTQAKEQKKNHLGDIEGWMQVGLDQIWICCYYSIRAQCIKTFYQNPPMFVIEQQYKKLEEEHKRKTNEITFTAIVKAKEIRDRAINKALKIETEAWAQPRDNNIELQEEKNHQLLLRWFKEQLHSAHYVGSNGYPDVALKVINKLSNMPNLNSVLEAELWLQEKP